MHGRGQPAQAAEKDHRSGAGHRPHGGRGRALRGRAFADQRRQERPAPRGAGGAGGPYQALRARRHRTRRRGADHRQFYQGRGALRQHEIALFDPSGLAPVFFAPA